MNMFSERMEYLKTWNCDREEGMEKKKYKEKPMEGMVRA